MIIFYEVYLGLDLFFCRLNMYIQNEMKMNCIDFVEYLENELKDIIIV